MSVSRRIEKALFDAALNLSDPAERQSFLDQACDGEPGLRARLDGLLAIQEPAEEFFQGAAAVRNLTLPSEGMPTSPCFSNHPLPAEFPLGEAAGQSIGNYKLLERIGAGGCGVVYRAEQEKPIRRGVALKIIRLGMDTESVIARFEQERQALALMDHPNIAHVLDAGATETGRPYFVMELVRGIKITKFCDENNLAVPERLELFVRVCHAVQHAHQKGVIHRDIKPSNILVMRHDGLPVPKVIDFGIAKATDGRLTDHTVFTAIEQFIGTPAYMSPEQAEVSALDVDTRSDIYSLGVLLYELLTGRTPFDQKQLVDSGLDALRRTLREREPQRPSTMLASLDREQLIVAGRHRQSEPMKLISSVCGDLDWIVMKALEKDRTRRYETANGLAMDVQRYLNHEPVVARPPSGLYRLQKAVRRNRGVFMALAAAALTLMLGFGTSTWLFFKEREAHRRAVAAEQQQSRLREEAERGRAEENELRLQAEVHDKLAEAAVLIRSNELQRADQLIASATLPQKMLEGATIFRALGDWNAAQKRWAQAANYTEMLIRAGQFETGDNSTLDYARCSCALMQLGSAERYENFRRVSINRFAGASDPVSAERIVKACLLTPASKSVMESLAPLARVAIETFPEAGMATGDYMLPWRSVSLALWEYRCGHWSESARWARWCLDAGTDNNSRTSTARIILAMASKQQQREEQAREEFAKGLSLIDGKLRDGFDIGDGGRGFWFDWTFAQVLAREAALLIQGTLPQNGATLR